MHASSSSNDLRAHASAPRPAPHLVKMSEDPLSRVIDLGTDRRFVGATIALLIALSAHGTAAARMALINVDLLAWTHNLRFLIAEKLASTYDIEVEKPKPPPEPEPEPKEEPKEEKAPPPRAAPKEAAPPPPPAAAQAGAVLTQKPDDTPVDFTNSFVTGNADTYAGGVTQTNGTSTTAVRNLNARAAGAPAGTGTAPAPVLAGPDRSRQLALTSKDWHCDFPPEADSEQIDQMLVPIEVNVSASGRVTSARAIKDPGYGFARAAVQCALRQGGSAFDVALDHEGNPIAGQRTFNVHFDR